MSGPGGQQREEPRRVAIDLGRDKVLQTGRGDSLGGQRVMGNEPAPEASEVTGVI